MISFFAAASATNIVLINVFAADEGSVGIFEHKQIVCILLWVEEKFLLKLCAIYVSCFLSVKMPKAIKLKTEQQKNYVLNISLG